MGGLERRRHSHAEQGTGRHVRIVAMTAYAMKATASAACSGIGWVSHQAAPAERLFAAVEHRERVRSPATETETPATIFDQGPC